MTADTFVKEQLYVEVVAGVLPQLMKYGGKFSDHIDESHEIALACLKNYDKAFPDGKKPVA